MFLNSLKNIIKKIRVLKKKRNVKLQSDFVEFQCFSSEREQLISICHLEMGRMKCDKDQIIQRSSSHKASLITPISTRFSLFQRLYHFVISLLNYVEYTLSPFVLCTPYTIQVVVVSECVEIRDESRVLLVMLA